MTESRSFPIRLQRGAEVFPTDAVLVETDQGSVALGLLAAIGSGAQVRLFRVEGGILAVLGPGLDAARLDLLATRGVRLRALARRFFVPIEAAVVPALLDDEAEGLTRDRGLVLLADGRALAFDPGLPLGLADLCLARRKPSRDWRPPAEAPRFADRLELITRIPTPADAGDAQPGAVVPVDPDGGDPLDDLKGEIGTESPRPEAAGPARTFLGRATLHAGQGVRSLGDWLGLKGLSAIGASLMGTAMSLAPRLSEAVLGKQEGAIRELLRMFREGMIDDALRHALPLSEESGRGSGIATDARLPERDPNYSLRSLLGDHSGRGPTSLWLGGMDLHQELQREYHRAAAEALVRGDIRRAAFIHGRLLGDFHSAADILSRGGLHHDAAWLYLHKLNNPLRAAQEFEAAGEIGRAMTLLLQREEHALVGDLLKRAGDPEGALPHYRNAAVAMASRNGATGALAAGDLMRDRAGRPDLAMPFYALGWSRRPDPQALPCALRLAAYSAEMADGHTLLTLIAEVDLEFQGVGRDEEAAGFYHTIAELAERPALAGFRDELRDRALLGLAAKLRQGVVVRSNHLSLVANLLGRSSAWPAEVLSDASAAVQEAVVQEKNRRNARVPRGVRNDRPSHGFRTVPIARSGRVTAAAFSALGEGFVGFEDGTLVHVNAAHPPRLLLRGDPYGLPGGPGDVAAPFSISTAVTPLGSVQSIGVDPSASVAIVIWSEGQVQPLFRSRADRNDAMPGVTYSLQERILARKVRSVHPELDAWVTPILPDLGSDSLYHFGLWNGEEFRLANSHWGREDSVREVRLDFCKTPPTSGVLLNRPPVSGTSSPTGRVPTTPLILVHDGPDWCLVDLEGKSPRRRYLGWAPGVPGEDPHEARRPVISCLAVEPGVLEIAGVTASGGLRWSSLRIGERDFVLPGKAGVDEPAYLAASLLRPGLVVAATRDQVHWLYCDARRIERLASVDLPAGAEAVALGVNARGDELLIVTDDGRLLITPMVV